MSRASDLLAVLFFLALAATLLAWTALPLWVLTSRRDPPVRLLAAAGPLLGLMMPLGVWELFGRHVLMTSAVFASFFWSSTAAVLALVVFLQPAEQGAPRVALGMPGRRQGLELGLLVCAAPAQLLVLPLPAMLASLGLLMLGWREGERARRVRAELSALVAAAVLVIALFLVSLGDLCFASLALFLLPLLGVPLLAWREQGLPRGLLGWLALPMLLWSGGAAIELEARTRLDRALWGQDLDALPASEVWGWLPEDLCVATPARACPGGVDALLLWPAEAPLGPRLSSGAVTWVAYRTGDEVRGVQILSPGYELGGQRATRGERGLRLDGREVTAEELAAGGSQAITLDPAVDWTAAEVVALCAARLCEVGPRAPEPGEP
jgi:hypothetical protein